MGRHASLEELRCALDAVRNAPIPAGDANCRRALLEADADASAHAAVTNIGRATDYVLAVVLLAAALFFAGISMKRQRPALRRSLLIFGLVAFLGTVAWIATFPVSVSI